MSSVAAKSKKVESIVLFMYAETPVHAGAGTGKTALDQPIQRSVQTSYPIFQDATLRGCLRRLAPKPNEDAWFGDQYHEGVFTTPDCEVLLFPVASAKNTAAWVTCKAALKQFERRLDLFDVKGSEASAFRNALQTITQAGGTLDSALPVVNDGSCAIAWNNSIILESDCFTFDVEKTCNGIADWLVKYALPFIDPYWTGRVGDSLVIVHDEVFKHYVLRSTDLRTRVKIDEGVAAGSGPWTEENLPAETLLYTVLTQMYEPKDADDPGPLSAFLDHVQTAHRSLLQLGGEQTLGRGILRLKAF